MGWAVKCELERRWAQLSQGEDGGSALWALPLHLGSVPTKDVDCVSEHHFLDGFG